MALDTLYSILINLYPLALAFLPYFFLRKRVIGKVYLRIYYGLCLFFFIYWVLPVIFQYNAAIMFVIPAQANAWLGIGYITLRSIALFELYLEYPFTILPIIFIVAPLFLVPLNDSSNKIRKWNHNREIESIKLWI